MNSEGGSGTGRQTKADLVGGRLDAETGNVRQTVVQRPHGIPELRFGTTGAAVTGTDRPAGLFVIPLGRAVVERGRPLAPHLVEAEPLAMGIITPMLDILSGVEMRTPLAVVVNALAVCEQRAPLTVQRRNFAEHQVMYYRGGQVICVARAAGAVDDGSARHRIPDADSAGRIGHGGGNTAKGSAGSDSDCRRGAAADPPDDIQMRLAAGAAVDSVILHRNGALDDANIFAFVLGDGVFKRFLGLVTSGRHDGFMVVNRQDVKHDLTDGRIGGPQQRFRIAGAALEFDPDQRRALDLVQSLGNGWGKRGG